MMHIENVAIVGMVGIAIVASLGPADTAVAQADRNAAARAALARLVLRLEADRAAGLAEVNAGKAAPPGRAGPYCAGIADVGREGARDSSDSFAGCADRPYARVANKRR